jgi:hypothetical protein
MGCVYEIVTLSFVVSLNVEVDEAMKVARNTSKHLHDFTSSPLNRCSCWLHPVQRSSVIVKQTALIVLQVYTYHFRVFPLPPHNLRSQYVCPNQAVVGSLLLGCSICFTVTLRRGELSESESRDEQIAHNL